MRNKFFFFLILFFEFINQPVNAGIPDFQFKHLTLNDGLSSNGLRTLFQDSKGFIWITSIDGLNRFDGLHVTKYLHRTGDSTSLPVNFTVSVDEDLNGDIWIGCAGSFVSRYNYESNSFTNYNFKIFSTEILSKPLDKCEVHCCDGNIWVLNNNKIYLFIKKTNQFEEIKLNEKIAVENQAQNGWFYVSPDKKIYCRTTGDLYELNADGSIRKKFFNDSSDNYFFRQCYLSALFFDGKNNLWFSCWNDYKSYCYKNTTEKFEPVNLETKTIMSNVINYIIEYKEFILASTYSHGIYLIDKISLKPIKNFTHEAFSPTSLSYFGAQSMLYDHQGTLWISTSGGLDYYNPINNQFRYIQNSVKLSTGLIIPSVVSAYELSRDNFLLGEIGVGMCYWKKGDSVINQISSPEDLKIAGNKTLIYCILKKDETHLWVGLQWGAAIFDLKTNTLSDTINFPDEASFLSRHSIVKIIEDKAGNTWFCTAQNGVVVFNKKNNQYRIFSHESHENKIPGNQISSVACDEEGNIWLAVKEFKGLIKFHSGTLEIELVPFSIDKFQTSFSGFINAIILDGDSLLWIGTWDYGLLKFYVRTNKFISFTEKDGLCNGSITGITTDKKNNLWIITQNGLANFDKKTKQFKNYFLESGLKQTQFESLIFTSQSGDIYIGSSTGIIKFNPDSIISNTLPPRTFITTMLVNGDRYLWNANHNLNSFPSDKKNFSFEFSGINFIDPLHNQYAYRLLGYQSSWTYCGNRQFASFTNLGGGDYIFEVKAANKDGIWESNPFSISFHIDTPFYLRWWFYFLSLLTVTVVLYFLYRIRINRLLAIEKIRTSISRDLHDDVGSALSSINIWSSVAKTEMERDAKKANEYLNRIRSSSQNMLDSMNDIIWAINPMNDTVEKILVRMKIYASEILEPNKIKFEFEITNDLKKVEIPMQYRREIFLIFKEAINNAVKYSGADLIKIKMMINNRQLFFSIRDNGKGFSPEENNSGNGLRNMNERANKMNAQFQLSSSYGNGTEISLKIKIT